MVQVQEIRAEAHGARHLELVLEGGVVRHLQEEDGEAAGPVEAGAARLRLLGRVVTADGVPEAGGGDQVLVGRPTGGMYNNSSITLSCIIIFAWERALFNRHSPEFVLKVCPPWDASIT